MSDTRLRIYLNDHLALAVGEIELVERCARNNSNGELGEFLRQLEMQLKAERKIIEDMLRKVSGTPNPIKQGLAWLAEKAGRLKLNDELMKYSDLSRLLELDTLSAAANQRQVMWDNLKETREGDERLKDTDFGKHVEAAASHQARLRGFRLEAAKPALSQSA